MLTERYLFGHIMYLSQILRKLSKAQPAMLTNSSTADRARLTASLKTGVVLAFNTDLLVLMLFML
jgi:hypothetical protein